MIYVYALTDPLEAPPDGEPGLAGEPLETVAVEGVAAVFSACAAPPAVDRENLWRHEAVSEAVVPGAAVLPTRFGTTLTSIERLRSVLARNHAAIRAGLDHVRGCVEVGVRVLGGGDDRPGTAEPPARSAVTGPEPDGAARGTGPGRAYLLRRLAEERRGRPGGEGAESVLAEVHLPLAAAARDAVVRPTRGAGLLATAYLVERDRLDGFVATVRDLDRVRTDRQVLCTGPWPPYSFAPALELGESLDA